MDYYEGRRVVYKEGATFIPVCPICHRFVRAYKTIYVNGLGEIADRPNAICKKHGKVQMPFEGYY